MGTALRVGIFLGLAQIKRTSFWTNALIVFIMLLTFLNLVVVNGILVGLIEGSSQAYIAQYSGDVILSNNTNRTHILQTPEITSYIQKHPDVVSYSVRYLQSGTVEATLERRIDERVPNNKTGTIITGINPANEDQVTNLSSLIVEGEYLSSDDVQGILIGTDILDEYNTFDDPRNPALENVRVGDKVRVQVEGQEQEYTVRGIVQSKIGEVGQRVFMLDTRLRQLITRANRLDADEIAIRLINSSDQAAQLFAQDLKDNGFDQSALIQTAKESQGQFFIDIKNTFTILGNLIGLIGIVVASITVFIVIFINAITRKRFIGILKGIGIRGVAIEIAYITQSIIYALIGAGLGLAATYFILVPFFAQHPIDFPFSDGILVAPFAQTIIRVLGLVITTLISGYIPARIIVNKNTLESILGR